MEMTVAQIVLGIVGIVGIFISLSLLVILYTNLEAEIRATKLDKTTEHVIQEIDEELEHKIRTNESVHIYMLIDSLEHPEKVVFSFENTEVEHKVRPCDFLRYMDDKYDNFLTVMEKIKNDENFRSEYKG